MKCENCGEEVKEGQKFCLQCGALIPQMKKCIKCGAELPLDAKFCSECGTNQSEINTNKEEQPIKMQDFDDDYLQSLSLDELIELEGKTHNSKVQFFLGDNYRKEDFDEMALTPEEQESNKKAFDWYQKSAAQGYVLGQFELGRMYEHGWGVQQDFLKAYDWYIKASNQNYGWGSANVADLYVEGNGVPQDYAKACEWFEKSIEQGCYFSASEVGKIYEEGLGGVQDYNKAFYYYDYYLNKNDLYEDCDIQYKIGYFYEKGLGVSKDLQKAKEFYKKAAENGSSEAEDALKKI